MLDGKVWDKLERRGMEFVYFTALFSIKVISGDLADCWGGRLKFGSHAIYSWAGGLRALWERWYSSQEQEFLGLGVLPCHRPEVHRSIRFSL
jgi:hypothetical protein